MKIYYDKSPAGQGKTERAIKCITSRKRKVLFFTERIKSFKELKPWMHAEAARQGIAPHIETAQAADKSSQDRNLSA